MNRRRLFAAFAGVSAGAASPALAREALPAAPVLRSEIDASTLGLHPNGEVDQSALLEQAIARAADAGAILRLPPGIYRAGGLQLPSYAALAGSSAGTTQILFTAGPSLFLSTGSDHLSLTDLVLDGGNAPLPENRGLVHLERGSAIRIADCTVVGSSGDGIRLQAIGGDVAGNTLEAANYAVFSNNAAGLKICGNSVRKAGNGGILVWRDTPRDDGTIVVDNRIENVANKLGGSGQWGNAINVFRANNVIVRGNQIRKAAFSAIRGNSASNLQIVGNTCSGLGEVALYSEFAFEGAVIASNIVDGAACGISVTNFDKGGRLAVVQGNIIRNIVLGHTNPNDPNGTPGVGIGTEADAVVSGNVVESVQGTGIQAGYGPYLRDVAITGNVVREVDYGIAISVAQGAGTAVVSDNLIAGARHGAIVGREWEKTVAGDLTAKSAARYAQLSIGNNRVR